MRHAQFSSWFALLGPLVSARSAALTLLACLTGLPAFAADWTEYRSGPLYVLSDAGDRDARDRLIEMEQIRWVLGNMLGSNAIGGEELDAIWPIELVLFDREADAATYATQSPFIEGGSANLSVAHADDDGQFSPASIAWRHDIVRQLLDSNAGSLPPEVETALADLFSTILVEPTKAELGAPLPEGLIAGDRLRAWQKIHLLATGEQYAGRFRIYLNNLQGGDLDLAARNTFGISAAELERRMNAYADAGEFTAMPVSGKPINPEQAFYERRLEDPEVDALLAELKSAGSNFPPDSPRGLLSAGDVESLRLAAARNPKWALPHVRLADFETNPEAKAQRFQKAVELEPRQIAYWESLAEAYTAARMFPEAARAWLGAERASTSDEERGRLSQRRRDIEEERIEAELAAANEARLARDAEVERVRLESEARVQAVLDRINQENQALSTAEAPNEDEAIGFEEAFGGTYSIRGNLTAVGCVNGWLRLIVRQTGDELAILKMVPPEAGAVTTAEDDPFATCGDVNPPRRITIDHDGVPDERLGTIGNVQSYILP